MEAETSTRAGRWLSRVRWTQGLVYSALGLVLLGTALEGWRDVEAVRAELTSAQGRRLLFMVGWSLGQAGRLTTDTLQLALEAGRDEGLRCIVATSGDASGPVAVGDCRLPPSDLLAALPRTRPGSVLDLGGLAAISLDPPPAKPWPVPPPPGGGGGLGWPPPPLGRPPPWQVGPSGRDRGGPPGRLLVAYEPLEANALRRSAARTLGAAALTALALLVATVVLWHLSRRAERLQSSAENDRTFVTLGQMSAVLAHEIRNPLASLKGHAQLLVERLGSAPETERAERLVGEIRRLEGLIEDLLRFVRSNKIVPLPVDPAAVLRAAVAGVGSGRVDVESAGAPSTWCLDAGRVQQALENLLRNADEASPPTARIVAWVGTQDQRLVFGVRDRGPGLPPGGEQLPFEAFHTTRVHGTGLGLAVVRRVAELHGGSATARTHPEGGAEFLLVIP